MILFNLVGIGHGENGYTTIDLDYTETSMESVTASE